MRFVLAMTAVALVIGSSAQGADLKYTCTRGDTTRSVSVVSQPSSGYACEVQYQKTSMGDDPEVLWHADSGTDFCVQQAQTLAQRLGDAGWTCAQGSGETAALVDDQSPQPYAVPVEVGSAYPTDGAAVQASGVTAAIAPEAPAGAAPAPVKSTAPNFELRPPLH